MAKKRRKKDIKIPKSVKDLRLSPKKFAKKEGIRISGKGVSKGERKRNRKRLKEAYSEAAINGLNKAVKIISENDKENKKVLRVAEGVENIITNPAVMKRIAKLYRKNPDNYDDMIFLPDMIMNTLARLIREDISDEDKEIADSIDKDGLTDFCAKILKRQIKRYRSHGLSDDISFQLACVIPTTKIFKTRRGYINLIRSLYIMAETEEVELKAVLPAVQRIDKKKSISKKDFYEGFFSEFIKRRASNRNHSYNDSQKELHESLIEASLTYLDNLKTRRCKELLKDYIKFRKNAESDNRDGKRVIKFIDYANSNSSYTNIKSAVQELISDNSSNELYLSS